MSLGALMRSPKARLAGALGLLAATISIFGSVLVVLFMAYDAASHWTHRARSLPDATPAQYGLEYEDVQLVTEDGLRLAAWYVPSRNRAALLVLHGLGGNRSGDLPMVRDLAELGYGLLVLDLRAHGDSGGTVSTLSFHEVRDVRSATRYLQGRAEVDPERIGVWGASLGAATAIMAAAEMPELKAVAADSSFASVEWLVQQQFQNLDNVPVWLAPVVVTMGSWQTGVNAADIAPARRIGRISPRPVMIMHGELDELFLVENATLLAQAAGEPKVVWIGAGIPHTGLYAADPKTYVQRLGAFFGAALQPKSSMATADETPASETIEARPAKIEE